MFKHQSRILLVTHPRHSVKTPRGQAVVVGQTYFWSEGHTKNALQSLKTGLKGISQTCK